MFDFSGSSLRIPRAISTILMSRSRFLLKYPSPAMLRVAKAPIKAPDSAATVDFFSAIPNSQKRLFPLGSHPSILLHQLLLFGRTYIVSLLKGKYAYRFSTNGGSSHLRDHRRVETSLALSIDFRPAIGVRCLLNIIREFCCLEMVCYRYTHNVPMDGRLLLIVSPADRHHRHS